MPLAAAFCRELHVSTTVLMALLKWRLHVSFRIHLCGIRSLTSLHPPTAHPFLSGSHFYPPTRSAQVCHTVCLYRCKLVTMLKLSNSCAASFVATMISVVVQSAHGDDVQWQVKKNYVLNIDPKECPMQTYQCSTSSCCEKDAEVYALQHPTTTYILFTPTTTIAPSACLACQANPPPTNDDSRWEIADGFVSWYKVSATPSPTPSPASWIPVRSSRNYWISSIIALAYVTLYVALNIIPGLLCVLINCKRNEWKGGLSSAFSPDCIPGRFKGKKEFRFFRAGTSLQAYAMRIVMAILETVTGGLLSACKDVHEAHHFFEDARFNDEEAEFAGDSCSFCTEVVIVNKILDIVTGKLWTLFCCAERRERKWLDERIRWKSRRPAEWVFHRAKPGYLFKRVMDVIDVLTFHLINPHIRFCMIRNFFETAPEAVLGGYRVKFTGTVCDYYIGVYLPNQFFTMITCGMWGFLGFAARRDGRWLDGNIEVVHTDRGTMERGYAPPTDVVQQSPQPQVDVPQKAVLLPRVAADVTHPIQSHLDKDGYLLSTEARLEALYAKYDPSKDAATVAAKFRGDEARLFTLLISKYGQDAIDASDRSALEALHSEV